jgi:predicted TPR repeat methyltransferase
MILEANGELDDAEKLYAGMLELNKANALAYKRLVCVALARGDLDAAVEQLNEYLKNFSADHSAVSIAG